MIPRGDLHMKKFVLTMVCVILALSAFADEKRFSVPIGDSPAQGPADAQVTIIEFLDFQ